MMRLYDSLETWWQRRVEKKYNLFFKLHKIKSIHWIRKQIIRIQQKKMFLGVV